MTLAARLRRRIWVVTSAYLVFASLWILLSDQLLAVFVRDQASFLRFSVYKGVAFVLVTAALLLAMMRRVLGAVADSDARERERTESLLSGQNRILEQIAQGTARAPVLNSIVQFIESQAPGMLCSVLLLDDDGAHLRHGAGPSLPLEYMKAVDGSSIGPLAGSCGTAAFTAEPVYVQDIESDERWAAYRHLVKPYGYRSCWSTPIFDAAKRVKGTFAMYYTRTGMPTREHLDLIRIATQLAAVALERDRTAGALRESESRFNAFMDAAPIIAWVADEGGRHLYMNRAWSVAFEREREMFYGRTAADIVPREIAERIRETDAEVLATDAPVHVPEDRTMYSGGEHWWSTVKFPFRNASGERLIGGVALDITARKKVESELDALRTRLQVVVENLREGLLIVSPGRDVHWNPAALRLLGYENPDEGRRDQARFAELFEMSTLEGTRLARTEWPLARVLHGELLTNHEVRLRRIGTEWERILCYSGARVALPNGQSLSFVTVSDVTRRHEQERELRELNASLEARVEERTVELRAALVRAESADRIKSAFLATMSHELRTPLNSIIGFTGILAQGLAGPLLPEQQRQLEMVRGSARHLLALINDVLDISKIEAGQLEVTSSRFAVRPMLERLVESMRPAAERKGLTLRIEADDIPEELDTDQRRVEQILLNLISNAVKFTERGGVTLLARSEPHYRHLATAPFVSAVRFAVRDTGVGISERDLPTLFQPFRQLDSGLARHHDGTGLGLSISHRLTTLLGGDIHAVSEYGVGSSFTVVIPTKLEIKP